MVAGTFPIMTDWLSKVPAQRESNEYFEWYKHREGEGGAHVPTARGVTLLESLLGKLQVVTPELEAFFDRHKRAKRLRSMDSARAQAINYLVKLWPVGLTRDSLNSLFGERGLLSQHHGLSPSRDPIQLVNKVEQGGIRDLREEMFDSAGAKHVVYRIPVPIQFTDVRMGVRSGDQPADKARQVEAIKGWLRHEFLDVPAERWQVGHRDPTRPDSDPENVVMQPPGYNQSRRNKFIFDERGFVICPTVDEFCARTRRYVANAEDARRLIAALRKAYPSANEPG